MRVGLKNKVLYGIGFVLIVILVYGWRLGMGIAVHSDETCNIFVGFDMFQGNIFLKDWFFSTGIFGLTTLELSLATLVLGYSDTIIYIIAAINYTLLIMACVYIVKKTSGEGKESFLYSIIVVCILIVPRTEPLLNAGTHVLSYAVSVGAIYLTYGLSNRICRTWLKIVWGGILGFLALTNSMFLYTTCIPIICVGVLIAYKDKKELNRYQMLTYGMVSLIVYAVLKRTWEFLRGADLGGINTIFVTRDGILNHIVIGICNILELYGINFWGENVISISTCRSIVGLFILASLMCETYKFLKSNRGKERILIWLFLFMALVNLGAYIFSTVPAYSPGTNLLQPFLIGFTTASILSWIYNVRNNISKMHIRLFGVASIIFLVIMLPAFTLKQPDNSSKQQAAEYLVENGYEKGFGAYWDAASIMYEAHGNVIITPVVSDAAAVTGDARNIISFRWMNKKEWEQQEGNFLVVDADSAIQYGINDENILFTFGAYSDIKQFGDITVYVWEENKKLLDY